MTIKQFFPNLDPKARIAAGRRFSQRYRALHGEAPVTVPEEEFQVCTYRYEFLLAAFKKRFKRHLIRSFPDSDFTTYRIGRRKRISSIKIENSS